MNRVIALVIGIALMVPSVALAQGSSTCQSYNPQLCAVANNHNNDARTTATTAAGTLPFTGLDVVLLAAGGGVLLGAGLLVRRLSKDLS